MYNSLQPHGVSMGFSRQEYWRRVAIPFSRGSSQLRDQTWVSCITGRFFTILSRQARPNILPGGDYDNGFPSRGSGLQENNTDSRKAASVFAFFQVPTTQNNQYSKVAYFGVVCPSLIATTVTAFSEKILLKG